jgi:hypothetical protein
MTREEMLRVVYTADELLQGVIDELDHEVGEPLSPTRVG